MSKPGIKSKIYTLNSKLMSYHLSSVQNKDSMRDGVW